MNIEDSLRKLVAIGLPKSQEKIFSENNKTLVAQACILIGDAIGFSLSSRSFNKESLQEICETEQINFRELKLAQNWWEQDHGPFFGYYQKEPVALICEGKKYYIFSPALQEKIPVNENSSKEISTTAYMVYPPLEEEMGTFRKLINVFFQKKLKEYFLLILSGLLATLIAFFVPIATKILFDRVIPHFDFSLLNQVLLGLLVAMIGSSIFILIRSFASLRLNIKIANHLQIALWNRIFKLPVNFFRRIPRGDLIQRTLIFETIRRILGQNTLIAILDSLFGVFYLFLMFFYSWKLALMSLAIIIISTVISFFIGIFKIRYDKFVLQSNAEINAFLISMINGIEKLRSNAAENFVFVHWAETFAKNQDIFLKSNFLGAIIETTNKALSYFSLLIIYGLVIWQRFQDPSVLTLGGYLAFIAAFTPFYLTIYQFLSIGVTLISLIPFWHRVKPLLAEKLEETKGQRPPGSLMGKITFSQVSFRYYKNSPYVLKEFSLDIQPKEFVALVGPSGSGKSTLCRLLVGFETPDSGSIEYDDLDLKEIILRDLRKQISLVMQDKAIFSGTIYENIVCGERFSYEEIQRVTKMTTFDKNIERFPSKLDTILPSGGKVLSGGERQKLLLCRALIRNPKILILDEGLNSLQSEDQNQIIQVLKSLNINTLFATHQLNLLTHVDRICLLEKGEISDQGTFESLYKKNEYFRKLVENQAL